MVGASQDVDLLLPEGGELERAVVDGRLAREKVRGRWLYLDPGTSVSDALDEAERVVTNRLGAWLFGGSPYLAGAAAKLTMSPAITKATMDVLVRELCCRGRLHGLGLVSQDYQPYLAFYVPADLSETDRQLRAMHEMLSSRGRVGWRDLPDPVTPRAFNAWRFLVIAHGEFLGLGWMPERGELVAW